MDRSPLTPEARRKRLAGLVHLPWQDAAGRTRYFAYWREIARRVFVGVYSDGFIHAGNLAYLSLVSLFPFFIIAASIAMASPAVVARIPFFSRYFASASRMSRWSSTIRTWGGLVIIILPCAGS